MYEIMLRAIHSGGYVMSEMLRRIDVMYAGGRLTEDQHIELIRLAREKVNPADHIDVLEKLKELEQRIFAVCREALDEVLDTSELDRIATRLQDQALGMAERVRKLVEENARVRRDQDEYQREYNALAAEHEKLTEKIRRLEEQKRNKTDRRRRIEIFLRMLEEQKECLEFDPCTFVSLTDKVIIQPDGNMQFMFRNGMRYEHSMI